MKLHSHPRRLPSTLADATRIGGVEMAKRFNLLTPMQRRVLE